MYMDPNLANYYDLRQHLFNHTGDSAGPTHTEYRRDFGHLDNYIASILESNRQLRVLDIGCGQGEWLSSMRQHYPHHHYMGCDLREIKLPDTIPLIQADMEHIDTFISQPVDLVISHRTLKYVPDKLKALRATQNILSPRGVGLIECPHHTIYPIDLQEHIYQQHPTRHSLSSIIHLTHDTPNLDNWQLDKCLIQEYGSVVVPVSVYKK